MHTYQFRSIPRLSLTTVIAAAALVSACSDSPLLPPVETPEAAINFQRVLVADAQAPSARLIALHNDSTVQSFSFTEPANRVYASHGARYGVVHLRTAGQVRFVDGGVWTSNGLGYRQAAAMLGYQIQDGLPTHENVRGDWISIFFDGSGFARWVRESEMLAGNPRVAFEANTGAAHHGGSFAIGGSTPLFAHSVPNQAGAPTGVTVRNLQGQVISQVATGECPGLHGNGSVESGGVFGCNNGMVLVRGNGTAEKVTLSGDMGGLALRNAYTGNGGSFILGQFAAFPGQPTQRVFATIDPASGAVHRLPALPAGVSDHWRAVEPVRGQIVMLGTNGTVYVFNGSTRQLQHTVANVVPALPTSGAMTHQIAVAEDLAVVASPSTGEVVLVNLANGSVTRRVHVGGAPSRVALLGATRTGEFTAVQ
jgi:hypothetical protein